MKYDNFADEFLFPGQIVHWFPDGDIGQTPHAGVVTKVAQHALCLTTWAPNFKDGICKDGVRHMSDPAKHEPELRRQGAWQHTPATLKLMALLRELSPNAKPAQAAKSSPPAAKP